MIFESAAYLAGFFTAHAVWCIEDGEILVPMLGFARAGEQQMLRFAGGGRHRKTPRGAGHGWRRIPSARSAPLS